MGAQDEEREKESRLAEEEDHGAMIREAEKELRREALHTYEGGLDVPDPGGQSVG